MRQILSLLLTALATTCIQAYDFEADGFRFTITSEEERTVEVVLNGQNGTINIPASVTYSGIGYTVTGIGGHAFAYGSLSVNIPNTVTYIISFPFQNTNLTSIILPEGLKRIDGAAFMNCTNLSTIEFPNSLTEIGTDAFTNTAWLNNQPDGLVYAGKVAYKYKGTMPEGTHIILESGTKGVAGQAFRSYSNLTAVTIPSSVSYIGDRAFEFCNRLESVHIKDLTAWCNIHFDFDFTPTNFGRSYTLYLDGEEISDLIIPSDVTAIGDGAFYRCKLNSIIMTTGIKSIGNWAFWYQSSLTSIAIPDGVKTIGDGAFADCTGLTSVTIPEGVTSVGESAFAGCVFR